MGTRRSVAVSSLVLSLACGGCDEPASVGEVPAASVDEVAGARIEADPHRSGPIVLAHGGQGSPASRSEGPALAVAQGFELLESGAQTGGDAVAAAIATLELLEDDPRFNAGTGANLRLDGRSIEADAAIMDDRERFGAVAGIRGVRHPIHAAAAVADTPHLLLAGEGAQRFAATLGLEPRNLATQQARDKLARGYARLFAGEAGAYSRWDWRKHWNFEAPAPASLEEAQALLAAGAEASPLAEQPGPEPDGERDESQDTVGVVVRSAAGRYAAALSTGGTTLAVHGRVGDVPVLGAGLYAGPAGAVAATGKGEAIIRERVAARVYELMRAGQTPSDAIRVVIRDITVEEGVGVIAVSELGWGTGATSQMAWAVREGEASAQADTWVQHRGR